MPASSGTFSAGFRKRQSRERAIRRCDNVGPSLSPWWTVMNVHPSARPSDFLERLSPGFLDSCSLLLVRRGQEKHFDPKFQP